MSLSPISSTLPSTQPLTDSAEDEFLNTPPYYENPWGRLIFQNFRNSEKSEKEKSETKPQNIDLLKDVYTAGRANTMDIVLSQEVVRSKVFHCISIKHFEIERKQLNVETYSGGNFENTANYIVLLKDHSRNGTYVNGKIIGQNNVHLLSNHDVIAVGLPTMNVFAFKDLSTNEPDIPKEVTSNYAILSVLGKGGYGEVRLVMKKDNARKYAMKTFKDNPNMPVDTWNEAKIWRLLDHKNIVKMHDMMKIGDDIFLFLDYFDGGTLLSYVTRRKRLAEKSAKFIFHQLLCGLNYLHEKKVVHRDIKPLNILMSSNDESPVVKISDFGLSKRMKSDRMEQTNVKCGTLQYSPPEIMATNKTYVDIRVDTWSAGVVLYYCLSGLLPFHRGRTDMPLEMQVSKINYQFIPADIWDREISQQAQNVVRRCLTTILIRPTVKQLLEDSWFRETKRNRNNSEQENMVAAYGRKRMKFDFR